LLLLEDLPVEVLFVVAHQPIPARQLLVGLDRDRYIYVHTSPSDIRAVGYALKSVSDL
jgi:hypothetical protein